MITLVKKIWNDTESQRVKTDVKYNTETVNNESSIFKDTCVRRKGIVTSLSGDHGVIDNFIKFDMDQLASDISDLCIGYKVEYSAHEKDGVINVLKVDNIVEQYWGDMSADKQLVSQIDQLKNVAPHCFNTPKRKLLGLVREIRNNEIIVDTEDDKSVTAKLHDVEMDFRPKIGDRVQLTCTVESNDNFVEKSAELLQVVRLEPSRKQCNQKRRVERVYQEFAVLDERAYVLSEDIPSDEKLHLGDFVQVDMIECEHDDFSWRCIQLNKLEKSFGLVKNIDNTKVSKTSENQPLLFCGEDHCILTEIGQRKTLTIKIKNNSITTKFRILCVKFEERKDRQLRLLEPTTPGFELEPGAEIQLIFEVVATFYGESTEYFTLKLEKFSIKKMIRVVVAQISSEVNAAERRLTAASLFAAGGRTMHQLQRKYAYESWSRKVDIVPGEYTTIQRRFVSERLFKYEVPKKLYDIYLNTERQKDRNLKVESMYPSMKEPLSFTNYVERFKLFLHLEEIEVYVNFRNYDRERANFVRDGEFLSLTIENLDERRPSLVVGDTVKAIDPSANKEIEARAYEGIIHKVLFNRILLKFNSSFQENYNGEEYHLVFGYSRLNFIKQHNALNKIKGHLGEQFLFPTTVQIRTNPQLEVRFDNEHKLRLYDSELKWYNPVLNSIQKRAVFNILRGETNNMPYVIFGPPGTGKTVTLVETILQLVRNLPSSRLLVGTPSNSSADLITQRLIDSGVLKKDEFVRLISQNQIEKDLIPDSLKPYCATIDIGADGTCEDNMIVTKSGLTLRCQSNYFGSKRVTVSTCATLGNFLKMKLRSNHFTHVLIDEAGQCTEPESIVPITMVSKSHGQVVLAGDPYQLPAIIINHLAAENGYSCSLMERIMEQTPYKKHQNRYEAFSGFDPRLMTKLLYNYRALPCIMNVYSQLFYNSELMSTVSEIDSRESKLLLKLEKDLSTIAENRLKTHGVLFHGIRSENMQEEDSPSWYNPGEAKSVFIMTIKLYRAGIKPDDIGIVTPYKKQVNHLRDMFIAADIAMPKIGSVEEFQGQERDIILVSTVRSSESHIRNDLRQSLGFVRCIKRMNVSISRARYLLMIFGNPYLLAMDESWRKLIRYAYDNGAYSGCDLPQILCEMNDDE